MYIYSKWHSNKFELVHCCVEINEMNIETRFVLKISTKLFVAYLDSESFLVIQTICLCLQHNTWHSRPGYNKTYPIVWCCELYYTHSLDSLEYGVYHCC